VTSTRHREIAAALGLFAIALAVRLGQHHSALLYPDGYQYLLMARGIAEHFEPTTVMGPDGDVFVPSPDAAAKPLFPLVVAVVHLLGVGWLTAAKLVTAVASAAAVALAFVLLRRVFHSWAAALVGAVLLLASTALAYWSGFSGPDSLAQALTLAAALAFVERRPTLGGALLGLAIASRPEVAVLGIAGAVLFARRDRHAVVRGFLACGGTLALVFGALRPPVGVPDEKFLALALLLACVVAVIARIEPGARAPGVVGAGLLAALVLAFSMSAGLRDLWAQDWPILVLGLVGFVIALFGSDRRSFAIGVLLAGALLCAVYWVKNPGLERYFAIVLPFVAAILAAAGVAELSRRGRWQPAAALPVVAAAAAVVLLGSSSPRHDADVFSRTAPRLATLLPPSDALVTAAPDAYSFWLPDQRVRVMRPGVRGWILLDPAQRAYAPELGARGSIVSSIDSGFAFSRPDGEIDAGLSTLVVGSVSQMPPNRQAQGRLPQRSGGR
jgi:hypothetical protein